MTSCRLVVNSEAMLLHRAARSASSRVQENSRHSAGGIDRSYASITLVSDTDLLPCCSRMRSSFGRLIPIGVTGPESPVSTTTSIALAEMPVTPCFRYRGSHGMSVFEPLRVARERSDGLGLRRG